MGGKGVQHGARETGLMWLGFAALSVAFWWVRIYLDRPTGAISFAWLDLYQYVLPAATFIRDELQAGRLPLWNPYQLAGMPTAALGMPGALYPGNLLLLAWLPAERALEVSTVAHWTLAGGFTWLFARRVGLGAAAATTAALTFMLSGRILSGAYQHFVVTTQIWLPALCWTLHGLVSERRARWALGLAACLALAFLGGYVQTFLYSVQLAAAYGVFAWLALCPAGSRTRVLGLAAAAGALGLALVAPQLAATLEFAGLANRGLDGIPLAEASRHAIAPGDLLAGLVGALATPNRSPQPYPWLVSLPALALPLALCALLARGARAHVGFFGVAALAAALFLLGPATPVFAGYHALPLGNLFRFPVRMDFVYVFCCALLLACGAHGLCECVRERAGRGAASVLGIALLLGVGGELFARSRLDITHPVLTPPTQTFAPAFAESARKSGARTLLPIAPKSGTRERVYAVSDYEPNLPLAYARYFAPRAMDRWHGQLGRREELESRRLLPLLDRMSVRFYAAPSGVTPARLRKLTDGQPSAEQPPLAERPAALPRTYVARRVHVEPDPERARAAMLAGDRRDVVVATAIETGRTPGNDTATLLQHGPQQVRISADCARTPVGRPRSTAVPARSSPPTCSTEAS
ncbi:MAG: hypothetical protein JRH16_20505 [Deltaproteobacteria bacterium]|nr:hypothetical protein [Deltaproteobacteria bacterium]